MSAAKSVRSDAADRQKKIIAGAVFAVVAAGVVYFELADFSPKTPPTTVSSGSAGAPNVPSPAVTASATRSSAPAAAPPGNAVGAAPHSVGSTSAALDPTLHMEAMLVTESVVYTGAGRNIFTGGAALPAATTAPLPRPIASGRPNTFATQPVTIPSGPPPLPPIDLKFFGIATSANGRRQAFLLHGDDVFLAANGDIVQRKYRVINVGPNSIQIEDLTNNNRQTLPLLVKP